MADYSLGTAHGQIKIGADTSGVDQADQAMGRLNKSAGSTEAALDRTGNVAGAAGLAVAGGLGMAVKTAADFEFQLSAIEAVSGATDAEMEKLRGTAMRIGQDTAYSASEAAMAMEELLKAGISTEDVLNGAADATVALAAAGGVDLPTAASLASNAMNQFNLTAEDLVGVTDTIAQAANASAIDVTDMGTSMAQVGAVANLAGLTFDETAIAIGQLGDAGIKGSDAGTSLKTMLMNLQPTTEAQTVAMEELGLITEDGANKFYNADGTLKDFRDVQDLLYNSTKDLTDAERQMALETIFGSDAIRAAAVLADGGAESFDNFRGKMDGVGTAAEVAKKRQDNLKGSFEAFTGSLETVGIQLGTALLPMLRTLTTALTGLVNWFGSLSPTTQSWIVGILAASAGLLLLTAGILKAVMGVRSMIATMRVLGILSTATRASFIKTAVVAVAQWAKIALSATLNAARTAAAWALAGVRMIAQWALLGAQAAIHAARVGAAWLLTTAANAATAVAQTAAAAARILARWAAMAARSALNAARIAGAWLLSAGAAAARAAAQTAAAAARIIGRWLWMGVQAMIHAARMAAAWFIALGPIGWVIAAVIGLVALIIANWDKIKKWTKAAWTWALNAVKSALRWMVSAVAGGIGSVVRTVSGLPGKIKSFFSGAASWLVSAGTNLLTGLWNGIASAGGWLRDKVLGWASSLVDSVTSFFGISSPSKLFAWMGEQLSVGMSVGVDDQASTAIQSVRDMAAGMSGAVGLSAGGPEAFWDASALGSGYVPPSPEVTAYSASQGDAAVATTPQTVVETNIYNPVAEKASDSVARRLRTLSALGAFGGTE